jgi:hypothetical protein
MSKDIGKVSVFAPYIVLLRFAYHLPKYGVRLSTA